MMNTLRNWAEQINNHFRNTGLADKMLYFVSLFRRFTEK